MSYEPSDADIEAQLAVAPDEAWSALRSSLAAVESAETYCEWRGGEVLPDGSIAMPYPEYSDAVDALRAALAGVGATVVFDWMGWSGLERFREPAAVAAAPVADAVRLVTAIWRSERFGDGNIAAALDRGLLQAAAARLLAWRAEPRL